MIPMKITSLLEETLTPRLPLLDAEHYSALRLFNGFYEGGPNLVIEIYARTLLVLDYSESPNSTFIQEVVGFYKTRLNWLQAGILKTRHARTPEEKRGRLIFGSTPDKKIREHDIWYAINLGMNRDASFYLDTRGLRKWLIEHASGLSILNTFAYTGSLGVAAAAGGAARVLQTDHSRQFLNLAKESYLLNGFSIHKQDFPVQDFFSVISHFKKTGTLFDLAIIDPPFFSTTSKGKVDLERESERLINKVRPLIRHGGMLVTVNNAVYVSGSDYMQTLESLCKDGYLSIRELIPIPPDCTGFKQMATPITNPAPFNHSTKIAVLDVKRKQ